jgi:glycosyltransferase involved in cell wall biosynthesis
MRIVFLSYNFSADIHDPQQWFERIKYYRGWLECLAATHTVIRIDQINYVGHTVYNGVEYCFVKGRRKSYFPTALNNFVASKQPDVVVVSSFLFPWQVILLRKTLGSAAVIIVQNHAEQPFTGLKKFLQRIASHNINCFLFTSAETGAAWVKNGNIHSAEKIKELMEVSSAFEPADKDTARQKTGAQGSPIFLWVGRLNPNKDPLTAVRAFLQFAAQQPAAKLYMIFQSDELLQDIKKMLPAVSSPVALLGSLPHHELEPWYNSADYFLAASHHEGSGTALCEAMSCGCIPIVSNIPSFKTITGDCGMLFEKGNVSSLLTALQQTPGINTESSRTKVLEHFCEHLSFPAIAGHFEKLLALS